MDYFIKMQQENQDRNQLDTEMREWAAKNINHMIVKDEISETFIPYLMQKASQLNAKYPRVKKNLRVSVHSSSADMMMITFSDQLTYAAHRVYRYFSPF